MLDVPDVPTFVEEESTAEAMGRAWAESGASAVELARELLGALRRFEDTVGVTLDEDERARLRRLGDEALLRALAAHEEVRSRRRDGWLSYHAHELRNPLNTLVNALWLLRNAEASAEKVRRVVDMAERATKKLEAHIREVRELEGRFVQPPPTRPGRPPGT